MIRGEGPRIHTRGTPRRQKALGLKEKEGKMVGKRKENKG